MTGSTNHKSQIGSKENLLNFISGQQLQPVSQKMPLLWHSILKLSQIININKCFILSFPAKIISNNKCRSSYQSIAFHPV